jgi:hypothetical protein
MVLLILGPLLGPIHLWIPLEGKGRGVGYGESRVENTKNEVLNYKIQTHNNINAK